MVTGARANNAVTEQVAMQCVSLGDKQFCGPAQML